MPLEHIIIPIGSDHAGFLMKKYFLEQLVKEGYILKDMGTRSEEPVDYPDIAHAVASAVNDGQYVFGILICGSGNGMNMTANKYSNIRSALCWNEEIAILARAHNNANIIALPARFLSFEQGLKIVKSFLRTEFEGGRHIRRVEKINRLMK